MKKVLYLISIIVFFFSTSCNDALVDLNEDTINPAIVPASALVGNATVALFDFMSSTSVNQNNFRLWSQQWAQTTYPDESNYQLVERDVNGYAWNRIYATILRDMKDARPLIEADQFLTVDEKAAQNAILDVMEVFCYHTLVDIFGDVPYSAAFGEDFTPAYDNDEDVYDSILEKLNTAISKLSGSSGLGNDDLIYAGDTGAWRKFANSLKLRMAIRIADKYDSRAKTMVEAAVTDGVFDASADNFQIAYQGSPPNTNPVWESLVQSGRSDFVAANTFGDYLNTLEDPRRSAYFKNLDVTDGSVIGGIYGAANSYSANSQPSLLLENPELPGVLMSYTEVRFLLADAAERGYSVGGTAEDHYNAAITESFADWGVSGAASYLTNPLVAYSTAAGTWKEKIAMQKWIALYNQGFEAWSTYRLYDAPVMNIADGAQTTPPLRYTYPVSEFSLNGESRAAAATAMGGDDLFSRVFWDIN